MSFFRLKFDFRAAKISTSGDKLPLTSLERLKLSKLGQRQSKQSREHRNWAGCFFRRSIRTIRNRRIKFTENGKNLSFNIHEYVRAFSDVEEVLLFEYVLKNSKFGEKNSVADYAKILPGFFAEKRQKLTIFRPRSVRSAVPTSLLSNDFGGALFALEIFRPRLGTIS